MNVLSVASGFLFCTFIGEFQSRDEHVIQSFVTSRIFIVMCILRGLFKLVFLEVYGILLFVMFLFSFTH